MSRNLGSSRVHPSTPTAVRATRPGWRDPRLWVGILIVAIRTHRPGETVEMSVLRGGEEQVVEVELDGKVG